jgi:thioredoxin family protein
MIRVILKKNSFCFHIIFFITVLLFISTFSFAGYETLRMSDFENNALPDNYFSIGKSFKQSVTVVKYSQIPDAPPNLYSGASGGSLGNYGLKLKAAPEIWITGLGDRSLLDRDRLGQNGKALFQADFYIPPQEEIIPSFAVLAMDTAMSEDNTPRQFYRFGFTSNDRLYFSFVSMSEDKAKIFKHDKKIIGSIPRSGWHRIAIVFEGSDTMHFYIDGREASFSPVKENTLRQLQVGIMLADKKNSYECYVDNMSIQWTMDSSPIPESPYSSSWRGSKPKPVTTRVIPLPFVSQGITWLDPESGWNKSSSTGIPMMVFFTSPRVTASKKLEKIFQTDNSAKIFAAKYIPVRIDVTNEQGRQLLSNFHIFKVPTIVLLDYQGQQTGKALFDEDDNWDSFVSKLGIR